MKYIIKIKRYQNNIFLLEINYLTIDCKQFFVFMITDLQNQNLFLKLILKLIYSLLSAAFGGLRIPGMSSWVELNLHGINDHPQL